MFLLVLLNIISKNEPNIDFVSGSSGLQVASDAACNDDLDFMEQINHELEVDTPSHEGVIKRSVLTTIW